MVFQPRVGELRLRTQSLEPGGSPGWTGRHEDSPASSCGEHSDQGVNVGAEVGAVAQEAAQPADEGVALSVAALLGRLFHEDGAIVQVAVCLQQMRARRQSGAEE